MNDSLSPLPSSHTSVLLGVSVALLVPVVLFEYAGFQVNLTLTLAPMAPLCVFLAPPRLRNLFLACTAAGLAAVGLAAVVFGTFQIRYVLSLLLMMTPPVYYFLGWYLSARGVRWSVLVLMLAVVSAVFVSVVALQTIVTGTQVRAEAGVLNLTLLGWTIYGSYGVLSFTGLLVLDLFVIAAGFLAAPGRARSWLMAIGFGATVFLVTGSNARGPQLALPYLAVVLGLIAWFRKPARARVGILLLVGVLSAIGSAARMVGNLRIVDTAKQLSDRSLPATPDVPRQQIDLESLSTGRESLLEDSFADIKKSPIFGNGFGSFGRIDRRVGERSVLSGNRTTHIQYLTALWKGGVLFFVPYMAMIGAFWLRAIRAVGVPLRADVALVGAGVVFLFTVLAFTWDILLVPSAGALAFFLLGAASEPERRTTA